jgi:hypothetical protein
MFTSEIMLTGVAVFLVMSWHIRPQGNEDFPRRRSEVDGEQNSVTFPRHTRRLLGHTHYYLRASQIKFLLTEIGSANFWTWHVGGAK